MRTEHAPSDPRPPGPIRRPRLGFCGVGWIGRSRLNALVEADIAEIVGVVDAAPGLASEVAEEAGCASDSSLGELLDRGLDGVVIATPSALHAEQSLHAIQQGVAVFCQKPLARTAAETRLVVDAARSRDVLLGTDMSYRWTDASQQMNRVLRGEGIGDIFAADLVFHNAYGPDKPWFTELSLSGGGCVMDLGIHLIDLSLWLLGWPEVTDVRSRLYKRGHPLSDASSIEDFAAAELVLAGGAVVRLSCSWFLNAGCDAVIEAWLYGTDGSVSMRNVGGSFYDFLGEHSHRTSRTIISEPPDDWGGRALVDWARRLAVSPGFDGSIDTSITVAKVIDGIYGRAG